MKNRPYKSITKLQALILMALLWGLSACSVKGNIEDLTEVVKKSRMGQQQGFVAGSQQNAVVNGYRVSSSIGDTSAGIKQSASGYTVYSSVQGSIATEVVETVYQ